MKRFLVEAVVIVLYIILLTTPVYGIALFLHLGGPPGGFPLGIYLSRLLIISFLVSILILSMIVFQKMGATIPDTGTIRVLPIFRVVKRDGHLEPFMTAVHGGVA